MLSRLQDPAPTPHRGGAPLATHALAGALVRRHFLGLLAPGATGGPLAFPQQVLHVLRLGVEVAVDGGRLGLGGSPLEILGDLVEGGVLVGVGAFEGPPHRHPEVLHGGFRQAQRLQLSHHGPPATDQLHLLKELGLVLEQELTTLLAELAEGPHGLLRRLQVPLDLLHLPQQLLLLLGVEVLVLVLHFQPHVAAAEDHLALKNQPPLVGGSQQRNH